MSYLRLGETHINYASENRMDRLILSQIVDSECSYKDPKLIRSSEELELYFGNSYKDYEYHCELLGSGATLYLYKPVPKKESESFEGYVDLSSLENFTINSSTTKRSLSKPTGEIISPDLTVEEIQRLQSAEAERTQYRRTHIFTDVTELPEKGIYEDGKSYLYQVLEEGEFRDYYYDDNLGEFVRVDYLPQNLRPDEYNLGKLNRDTLRLNYKGWEYSRNRKCFRSCNPRYSTETYTPSYPDLSEINKDNLLVSVSPYEGQLEEFEDFILALKLDFSGVSEINPGDYIVMPGPVNNNRDQIFVFDPDEEDLRPIGDNEVSGAFENTYSVVSGTTPREISEEIIKKIVEVGSWALSDESEYPVYKLWNKEGVVIDSQFFNIQGLKVEKDLQLTQDVLSVLSEDNKRIEFYSKTIGPGDENIKVKIKKIDSYNPERYRIEVSRYSYSEVFEGNLYIKEDKDGRVENLERIINDGSRLIECKIFRDQRFNIENEDAGLPEGEFYLRRADRENYSISDYYNSLEEMKKELKIKEDFILIPSKKVYSSDIDLSVILDYCNTKNNQALIVNTSEDFLSNFPEKDNRLVYFYNNLSYLGHSRPGYYIFLRDILGQTYLLPVGDINYKSPVTDSYNDYLGNLKKKKSNYLVYNEHEYYYRELFSHPGDYDYTLTVLSRYCQSHVSRVVEREFPALLGLVYSGDMMNQMNSILDRIKSNNRIIQNLYIEYVEQDDYNQKIDVYLHLDVRETADKDISLGIILNFNLT